MPELQPARPPAPDTPVAVGPVAVAEPVVADGWLVSAATTDAPLRLRDCSSEAKVIVHADPAGAFAAELGVDVGRAELFDDGLVVASVAPGEWLALAPGDGARLAGQLEGLVRGELVTAIELTHGLALFRVTGDDAAAVLTALGGPALRSAAFADGAATALLLAGARATVVRDDLVAATEGPEGAAGDRLLPSYLVVCDRSQGEHLHDALFGAGERLGMETEGYRPGGDRQG